jgi:hypothetical protein
MPADDPRTQGPPAGDWRPIPDPTSLTTDLVARAITAFREVVEARLNGMDRATELLAATVNRTPTEIEKQIRHLRELQDEKFVSIDLRFAERDVRTDQAAKASKEALDAALLAAKELVARGDVANAQAAEKVEVSTAKQIEQIGLRLETMREGIDDRMTEIKERLDRGEGGHAGSMETRSELREDHNTGVSHTVLALMSVSIVISIGALIASALLR